MKGFEKDMRTAADAVARINAEAAKTTAADAATARRFDAREKKLAKRINGLLAPRMLATAKEFRRLKWKAFDAASRDGGEGYVDVLIKILITVIVGASLLGVMNAALPQLFSDIIAKIRAVFNAGV